MDMNPKVDLSELKQVGSYPSCEEKLVLDLARAIHASRSDHCVTSWEAQVEANGYYNSHGFVATLDKLVKLQAENEAKREQADA